MYNPSQLIAALLCRRPGAKSVLAVGAAGWSLFTAEHGFYTLIAGRVAIGLTDGVAGLYHSIGEWAPVERSRALALISMGCCAGTTLALVLSPHFIRIYSWKAVFHIFSGAGIFWLAA